MKQIKTILLTSILTSVILLIGFVFVYPKISSDSNGSAFPPDTNHSSNFATIAGMQAAQNQIESSRQTVITQTVSQVSPAVVGINVTEIRQYRDAFSMDPFWRQWFGDRVYNQQVKSLGSGAIISPDGYILTNDHVAGNAVQAIVTLTDGTQYDAKVIGSDQTSDICLLKIDAKDLPYIKLGDSDNILIGEWVVALGNPFGLFDINDKPTVTVGVVSSKGMNLGASDNRYYVDMIQTDAAINGGNSGGPLVNAIGELIGMNTLIWTTGQSSGNVGVGFAIPVNKIKKIINELKSDGKVDRDFWVGFSVQTVDEGIAKYYGLKSTRGVIVTQVTSKSPADKSGLKVYDIIVGVDTYSVNNEVSLIGVLQEFRINDTAELHILRDNKPMTLKMKLTRK